MGSFLASRLTLKSSSIHFSLLTISLSLKRPWKNVRQFSIFPFGGLYVTQRNNFLNPTLSIFKDKVSYLPLLLFQPYKWTQKEPMFFLHRSPHPPLFLVQYVHQRVVTLRYSDHSYIMSYQVNVTSHQDIYRSTRIQ